MNRKLAGYGLLLLAAGLISSCGGGGGDTTPAPPPPADSGTATITAAAGGTVTTAAGTAQLVFPANAVSSNTAVTATAKTDVPTSARLVSGTTYEFTPAMTFAQPVRVSIKYDATKLPASALEANLKLYKVVGTAWQPVAGSTVNTSTRTVSAPVTSFSHYGILADNQFAGLYNGTYSGGQSGTWTASINVDGAISASATGGFDGTGTVAFTGASTIPLQGTGTAQGFTITFGGTFTLLGTGGVAGSGTWTSSGGLSGTWSGARNN